MPTVAIDPETNRVITSLDAEPGSYRCIDHEEEHLHYVSETDVEGQGTRIAHFRHDPGTRSASDGSVGGGGGGPAETTIHERRKREAMVAVVDHFGHDNIHSYGVEREYDSRRVDASVIFSDPHERYGQGIAIEYQHKNESKDKDAVTRDLNQLDLTVLWLGDDQYPDSGNKQLVPDIDIFGGRVEPPFPGGLPDDAYRDISTAYHTDTLGEYKVQNMDPEYNSKRGEFIYGPGSPATLPTDWIDEISQQIWQDQPWETIFLGKKLYPNTKPSTIKFETKIPASLPSDWFDDVSQEIWRSQQWESIFPGKKLYPNKRPDNIQFRKYIPAFIPINRWLKIDGQFSPINDSIQERFKKGRQQCSLPSFQLNPDYEEPEIDRRIKNIVKYNTGGPQPSAIKLHHIQIVAKSAGFEPNAAKQSVYRLVEYGKLIHTSDDRYMLPVNQ